jgi:hypothetical protein
MASTQQNSMLHAGAGPTWAAQQPMGRAASLLAAAKGFVFYTTTFALALPLFAAMLLLAPFVAAFDRHRRLAQHFVNNIWAKVSTTPYYGVQASCRHCTVHPVSMLHPCWLCFFRTRQCVMLSAQLMQMLRH